jgi:glutathione S-transferase
MTGQRSIPVLEHMSERIIGGPSILAYIDATWAERSLRSNESDVARRVAELYDQFASTLRDAWFPLILEDTGFCAAAFSIGRSATERAAYRTMFPVLKRAINVAWGLTSGRSQEARKALFVALDAFERTLPPVGQYLVGDTLSAADTAAASLLSPLISPGWSPYRLQDRLPESARALQEQVADRPSLVWVRELYSTHRGSSMAENSEIEGSGVL